MIAILIIGREALLLSLGVVSVVGYTELTKATHVHEEGKLINSLELVGIIATIVWYVSLEFTHTDNKDALSVGFFVMVLAVIANMVVYVLTFPKYNAPQVLASIFSFIYCPIMLSFVYLTRELELGVYLVWMVFVCSWFCDIFAYLVGVKFGKHKFVPKLSPKKAPKELLEGLPDLQ